MEALKNDKRWTYAEYCTWEDDVRCELIEGQLYVMSPSPTWQHQGVNNSINNKLYNYLNGKPCTVFTAPFDVRLDARGRDDTVVQPDIVVILDSSKLEATGCVGAPDMVVEILSPSTSTRDRKVKFDLYKRFGVPEYWIVDPAKRTVSANILSGGEYITHVYSESDAAPVHVLEGCTISLRDIFAGIR